MSSDAPAAPVTADAPAKKPKAESKKAKGTSKPKAPKAPASHPTYGEMIKAALVALKDKKGSSRAALLKYILQNYRVGDNLPSVNAHLRQALKRGVTSGFLKQTKGTGASGSFRLGEGKAEAVKKTKKPAAKKAVKTEKVVVKKAVKPKSPKPKAAKPKSEKKSKPSSPKKKVAPKPKKAASPKKAKVAKPKVVKKSAPKAKKAAPKTAAAPKASA